MPRRQPRVPIIGFVSARLAHAARAAPRPRRSARPVASAARSRASSTDSSSLRGRNSCSGGSSSRIVTGRPSIASKIPSKSARWSGSSSSSAARRSSSVLGHDHLAHLRLAVGLHEHVLGAAQADALGAEARVRGARRRGRRRSCARPCARMSSAQRSTVSKCLQISGEMSGTSSVVTAPVLPSIAIRSPLRSSRPVHRDRLAPRGRSAAPRRRTRRAGPSRGRRARRARPCRPPR